MIERYEDPQITGIFFLGRQYSRWLAIEIATLEAQIEFGIVPESDAPKWLGNLPTNHPNWIMKIRRLEEQTGHDVNAFVTAIARLARNEGEAGAQVERFLHFGLTSSDVVDTGWALALKNAQRNVITPDLRELNELMRNTERTKGAGVVPGRTHGQHALPITWARRIRRWRTQLTHAMHVFGSVNVPGKLSGPIGNYSPYLTPRVETAALSDLGIARSIEGEDSQCVPRHYYADYLYGLASITNSLEQMAIDIRLCMIPEIDEIRLRGASNAGSSSMPNKVNPVKAEKICGLARLNRGYLVAEMESQALWLERDISHSSVERVAMVDALHVTSHAITTMIELFRTMQFFGVVGELDSESTYNQLHEAILRGEGTREEIRGKLET